MKPENEMGVIVEFVRQETTSGYKIVSIQTEFPDATVERDGAVYRAEFEYKASNFIQHKHDPRDCDLVFCWENDTDLVLPTLALSQEGWSDKPIVLPSDLERECAHWKAEAQRMTAQAKNAQRDLANLRRQGVKELSTAQRILQEYERNPALRVSEVAKAVGVTRQAVNYHLGKMENNGIVKRNGHGVEVVADLG